MTLKDVANISGCSVATVSKVFKNSAEISEETKKKVLSVAEKVGYLKKATTSPLLLGGLKPVVFSDPHQKFISSLDKLNKMALQHGLSLLYVILKTEDSKKLAAQIGAWGLVLSQKSLEDAYYFDGNFSALSDKFKEFADFVPKRAPRTKTVAPKKPKAVANTRVYEKKNEDIWLL